MVGGNIMFLCYEVQVYGSFFAGRLVLNAEIQELPMYVITREETLASRLSVT